MTDVPTTTEETSRRPRATVQRDLTIVKLLAERPYNRHELDAALSAEWRVTYGSLCRLRNRGLVTLHRTGTRTPVWMLTEEGTAWYNGAAPAVEGERPAPPEPSEVISEVPTVEVPTEPAPEPEPQPEGTGFQTVV